MPHAHHVQRIRADPEKNDGVALCGDLAAGEKVAAMAELLRSGQNFLTAGPHSIEVKIFLPPATLLPGVKTDGPEVSQSGCGEVPPHTPPRTRALNCCFVLTRVTVPAFQC